MITTYTKMQFLPELKSFLSEYGEIYTVRKFDMQTRSVMVDDVGVCLRTRIGGEIKLMRDLKPYVALSGFQSVDDWWAMIKRFVHIGDRKFLYHVRLQQKESE